MKVLVVVDMQNDFIDGALGTPEAQAIVPKVVKKIEEFDGEVLWTQDTHSDDYLETQEGRLLPVKHCISASNGWQIHSSVKAAIQSKHPADDQLNGFEKKTFGSLAKVKETAPLLNDKGDTEMVEVVRNRWVIDREPPIFSQERGYVEKWI